jgi:hypothetical protein
MPENKKPAKTGVTAAKIAADNAKKTVAKAPVSKTENIEIPGSKVTTATVGNLNVIESAKDTAIPKLNGAKVSFRQKKLNGILGNEQLMFNTTRNFNKVINKFTEGISIVPKPGIPDSIVGAILANQKNKISNAPQMLSLMPKEFDPENFEYFIVVLSSKLGTVVPGLPVSLSRGIESLSDSGSVMPYELLDTAVTDHNGVALFVVDRDKITNVMENEDGEEVTGYSLLKLHTASGIPDISLPLIDVLLETVEIDIFKTSVLHKNIDITEELLNDFVRTVGEKFLTSILPPLEAVTGAPMNRLFGSIGDNPFDKLPALFPPEVLKRLLKVSRNIFRDPILSRNADEGDFRYNRKPIIRRFQAAKNFQNVTGSAVPDKVRNFLFNVRQDWNFIGYTLGELTELESLDPGKIVKNTVNEVESITESLQQTLSETLSKLTDSVSTSSLTETGINLLLEADLKVKNRISGGAIGGAMILPLPIPIALGGAAADVSHTLTSNSRVSSNLSTSVDINTSLQSVKEIVNNAIKRTLDTKKLVQNTLNTATDAISPLLSATANITRWGLYENYVVNTLIEEVIEIRSIQIFDVDTFRPRIPLEDLGLVPDLDLSLEDLQQIIDALGLPIRSFNSEFVQLDVFSEEEMVDYRRIFEPQLLDRSLKRHYGQLREIVNRQLSIENIGVTELEFTVFYESQMSVGGNLVLRIDPANGSDSMQTTVRLRSGSNQATGRIRFNGPVSTDDTGLIGQLAASLTVNDAPLAIGGVRVNRIGVKATFDNGTTQRKYFDSDLLSVDVSIFSNGGNTDIENFTLTAEFNIANPKANPLYRHINDNAVYYLGLLIETAFYEPALRTDSQKIREFISNLVTSSGGQLDPESFWSLPLIRFEGDRILIYQEIDLGDPIFKIIKAKEKGSAMKMQLLSQGSYSEVLQGVLSLPDALGKLHPSLVPELPPVTNVLSGLMSSGTLDPAAVEDLLNGVASGNVTEILENLSPEQATLLSQLIAGALGKIGGN